MVSGKRGVCFLFFLGARVVLVSVGLGEFVFVFVFLVFKLRFFRVLEDFGCFLEFRWRCGVGLGTFRRS